MTGRNATLLPRRWVVRANQADARAEKAEEPASEDDGPGRTFDDKQANDDEHGREDEPGPCSGLEDGHDDLPSISYTGVGSLRRPYTGRRAASSVLHQGTRRSWTDEAPYRVTRVSHAEHAGTCRARKPAPWSRLPMRLSVFRHTLRRRAPVLA
jgi:hypothetical protein